MIKKVLIANRGEIALRVIRACREMDISTVAVYSEVDRTAPHVRSADEAVCIGPPSPLESYLNIKKIVVAAKQFGCQAIHPGYGFLAENHLFASRCEMEGILFIGPSSKALRLVGDKIQSRKTVVKMGVPIIPGMLSGVKGNKALSNRAKEIGFPVVLKASAGGGGKGMQVVYDPSELKSAVESGKREAKSAFGDDTLYLEKYVERPRHIEFQVLADQHGNRVHLFERECSIQRRHQKIIEESPSPALDDRLRAEMGEVARKVIEHAGYSNAGTVEFLLDGEGNYYFLEVNARIQVEHPVTEMVTGVDLVKEQIRIADGEELGFTQEDLRQRGHSIECRIYAEDPENNFYPSFGKLLFVKEPTGPGIRCDSGIETGMEVPYHYDPILSKIIVWAENREEAIRRMAAALSETVVMGVKTQIPFLRDVIAHPDFRKGNLHTDFIARHFSQWKEEAQKECRMIALMVAAIRKVERSRQASETKSPSRLTPWQISTHWDSFS